MDKNAQLLETVQWIARADFYNETPRFGRVRYQYRNKFLVGAQLGPEVEFYFNKCVPTSTYEGNTRACWFYFNDSRDLWSTAHDRSYSGVLSDCGFLSIATDQGGNPLLVDPVAGKVHSFQFGYLRGNILTKPGKTHGWIEVPATLDTVSEWSQFSWDNLQRFFDDVKEMTAKWHQGSLVTQIAARQVAELKHYQSLGLGIRPDMLDDEGRTPLEVARETGNPEVIEIVEAILRENP